MNFSKDKIARGLLLVAAGISAFLAWQAFGSSGVAGCEGGASCEKLTSSSWARLFGLPVATRGLITYLAAAFLSPRVSQSIRAAVFFVIPLAAAWFIGVQIWAVGAFCVWCCLAHGLASIGAIILLSNCEFGNRKIVSPLLGAIAAIAMLASLQMINLDTSKSTKVEPLVGVYDLDSNSGASKGVLNEIQLLNGEVTFRLDELPVIGVSQPSHAIIALTDYTCSHCLQLHDVLQQAGLQLDNGVAIVKLPATRKGTDSEQVHRHMLALWKANPKMHWSLERSLIEGRISATAKSVENEAKRLIGQHEFADAAVRHRSWISEQITKTRRVREANRKKTGRGTLPQVIVGSELVLGSHSDPNYYVELAATQFGLTSMPLAAAESVPISLALNAEGSVRLGNVQPGQRLPFSVKFKNRGSDSIEISWLNMDANLELEIFTKEEIVPREEGELQLALNVPDDALPGELTRSLTVNPKDGRPSITFRIHATIASGLAQAGNSLEE